MKAHGEGRRSFAGCFVGLYFHFFAHISIWFSIRFQKLIEALQMQWSENVRISSGVFITGMRNEEGASPGSGQGSKELPRAGVRSCSAQGWAPFSMWSCWRKVPLANCGHVCNKTWEIFSSTRRVMFSPLCLSIKIITFKIINVLDGGTDPGWLSARLRVAARCALALAEPGGGEAL